MCGLSSERDSLEALAAGVGGLLLLSSRQEPRKGTSKANQCGDADHLEWQRLKAHLLPTFGGFLGLLNWILRC